MKQGMINAVVIVGTAMLLAACSGGGDGGGGGGTPAAAPTLTGAFVDDAPVAGLPYAASSGLGGTTNAQGQFSYRSGDTVTFSYGQTVSNAIPAAPQVTPWTAFGLNSPDTADPRWVNLARLLQTFNNVLPPVTPAIQALPGVNFQQSTAAFGADPAVVQLLAAANAPQPLVSAAQATQALTPQFAILGSWFAQNTSGPNFAVFTAMADGIFTVSEDGSNDPTGSNGMERGTYTWNPATGAFTRTIQVDTNGTNGISGATSPITVAVNGNTLTITDPAGSNVLTRVSDANPAVGAWRFDNTDGPGTLAVLTLFANGTFVVVTDESAPVHDGMERGSYSMALNGDATFIKTIDTNSDAGLFNPAVPVATLVNIAIAGDTMTLTFPGEPSSTGTRIRPPQ